MSLYINGEYQGLYNLATKDRYLSAPPEEVTALFEMSKLSRGFTIVSDNDLFFITRYGNSENILSVVNTFENLLFSDSASYQELEELIYTDLLAKMHFVDAITDNLDLALSHYFFIDRKNKIGSICAWDFDLTFNNFITTVYNEIHLTNTWYNLLFEYPDYRNSLLKLLEQHSFLLNSQIVAYEDSLYNYIKDDWVLNKLRWKNFAFARMEPPGFDMSTLEGQIAYIEDFREKRLNFLREYFSDPNKFCSLLIMYITDPVDGYLTYGLFFHKDDSLLENMLPSDLLSEAECWYTEDGTPLTDVKVINKNMSFKKSTAQDFRERLKEFLAYNSWLLLPILFLLFIVVTLIKTVIIPIKNGQ